MTSYKNKHMLMFSHISLPFGVTVDEPECCQPFLQHMIIMHIMPYITHHRRLRVVKLDCTLFSEISHDFKYCKNIKLQLKLLNAYSISVHISLQSIRYYLQEKGLATHSSILSCLGNPMDRGACQAIVHGDAKNTGMGCHSLHQEIFPTQGSNPGPLHCRRIFIFIFFTT